MSLPKERIDVLLVEQGYYESREKAKAAIMAGLVYANNEPIEKAGMKIPRDAQLKVKGSVHPYVGRGGLKLEKAIRHFNLNMNDLVMLDIGSSTGGFTDCALQHGASHVYAIDVGYNQLDWSLRNDERVTVMERTNFRYVTPEDLSGPVPNFASIDVSFISLTLILPVLKTLLVPNSDVVALVKPQFEAGKAEADRGGGVIRDPAIHARVLRELEEFVATEPKLNWKQVTESPLLGPAGNKEFLVLIEKRS